jgi:hypothetical protein
MNKEIEYKTLRNQIAENNKYAFERPIILTFLVGITFYISSVVLWYFLPLIGLILLIYNLNYEIKKLKSSNRILAYIQLALEKGIPYIGWETFLFHYENYTNKYKKELREVELTDIEQKTDSCKTFKSTRQLITFLGFIMFATSIAIVILSIPEEAYKPHPPILALFGALISFIAFIAILTYHSEIKNDEVTQHFSKEKYIVTQVLEEINNPKNPTI